MKNNSILNTQLINKISGFKLIIIGGAPASGKTFLSKRIAQKLQNAVVLSLDGYHIPRSQLDKQRLRIRGHVSTFDLKQFKTDFTKFKQQWKGQFPTFDHAIKDPILKALKIQAKNIVIIEGLWVFQQSLIGLYKDAIKIWININKQIQQKRIIQRHVQSGVTKNQKQAKQRFDFNDYPNGQLALQMVKKVGQVIYLQNNQQFE